MPETKNNRRVRFTRSALREALIDLILEKPLVSITVKDICARADINRSTFYLHFKDVTDILRTTEDEIIEHMREHTPTHKRKFRDLQEIEGFFIDFLEQIRNNPRIMKVIQVLCSEQGDPYFVRKLVGGKQCGGLALGGVKGAGVVHQIGDLQGRQTVLAASEEVSGAAHFEILLGYLESVRS